MKLSTLFSNMKKRLKRLKEDLEKESVSQSHEKPHCCSLPEDILYREKEEAEKKDKVA